MSDSWVTLLERAFALLIAFVLPGLVALFGIATVDPTVQKWFQGAQNGPSAVGLLFVLFAALALNVVITALRWFLFERLTIVRLGCPLVGAAPSVDLTKRKDCEAQYVDIRHQHYYHYLAYANTAVAVPLAVAAWKFGTTPEPDVWTYASVVGCALGVFVVLTAAACHAIGRYDAKLLELLGPAPATARPAA